MKRDDCAKEFYIMNNYSQYLEFNSRRSPVIARNAIVASSQPLASEAGIQIMKKGGNAADAAVATAAALNVVEPMSTGIGGDCFCLFYDNDLKKVSGLNGSGRAPANLTLDLINETTINHNQIPGGSPLAITVPGSAAGWVDTIEKFGRLTIQDVLQPAIKLAEEGFPVSPVISYAWMMGKGKLWTGPYGEELTIRGMEPKPGQIFKNPNLARVFRTLAAEGKDGYYQGWIADSIVSLMEELDGVLTHSDLRSHTSTFVNPITTNYRGIDVFEIPPNGQGITALIALNILEGFDIGSMDIWSVEYFHTLIETMRLAFADSKWFVADPEYEDVPIGDLLSKQYADERRRLIDRNSANLGFKHGAPRVGDDTVYFSVVDGDGNACSFINSNYASFGTGLVAKGTGFVLQNRGCNFSLDPNHPNVLKPGKRPYHTIIPGMAVKDEDLYASFGVMGGFMQPQGHLQVLSKMIDHGYEPQSALNAPRFYLDGGNPAGVVKLEEGIPEKVIRGLEEKNHKTKLVSGFNRSVFGNGQIIKRNLDDGVLWAGSDPRCDGAAYGY